MARTIINASDVTDDVLDAAEDVADSYFPDGPVDWEDFLEIMERGGTYDFGDSMLSPAIRKLQRHVRQHRANY